MFDTIYQQQQKNEKTEKVKYLNMNVNEILTLFEILLGILFS